MPELFSPWSIGPVELKHRIVLAPLTRIRADIDSLDPTDLMGEYYEQRASDGGLMITEVRPPRLQRYFTLLTGSGYLSLSQGRRYGRYPRTIHRRARRPVEGHHRSGQS
jgi:hypothetical protein